METMPTAAELIEAATDTIRGELLPALSGRAAFQARVAITVLETARRELLEGPAADAAELGRLRALTAALAASGGDPRSPGDAPLPSRGDPPPSGGGLPAADDAPPAPDAAASSPDAELAALRRALCDAIRDGRAGLDTPGLAEHLWSDTLARVAIDQPAYPSFVQEAAPRT